MPAVQDMFQSYLEELDSRDPQSQLKAIRCIKHNVIGSQAKKTQLTLLGAVPKLVAILANGETVSELVVETITVLGSLAHGPPETVQAIISSNAVPVLLEEVLSGEENVVNASTRTLCTLCVSRRAPCDIIYQNHRVVARLVEFLQSDSALLARSAAIIVARTCSSSEHQVTLAAGNILPALSTLIHHSCRKDLFHAAIEALSAVVYHNKETSRLAVNVLNFVHVLSEVLSSGHSPEVKLSAAECLTNLYRADTVGECSDVIQLKVLPSLIKFCRKSMDTEVRIKAARVLAYLIEDSAHLEERTAESERIITTLVNNLEPQPPKDEAQRMAYNGSEEELQLQLSEASLEVLAALCTHCEDLRTTVLDSRKVLMKHVSSALLGEEFGMKVAALKCILFWSRSPQQLRTTLIDYEIWRPLQELLSNRNETILTLATAAMGNFLLPVSASRQLLVDADVLPTLLLLLDHSSSAIQVNAAWALMNLSHQGTGEIPPQLFESSTVQHLIRVTSQERCPDELLLKSLATLSNILCIESEVEQLFLTHHEVLKAMLLQLLNVSQNSKVVEQILILILNLGSGTHRTKMMILEWEEFMKLTVERLRTPSTPDQLLAPLIGIVSALADAAVPNCVVRQNKLEEFGVKYALQKREASASNEVQPLIKSALSSLLAEPSLL